MFVLSMLIRVVRSSRHSDSSRSIDARCPHHGRPTGQTLADGGRTYPGTAHAVYGTYLCHPVTVWYCRRWAFLLISLTFNGYFHYTPARFCLNSDLIWSMVSRGLIPTVSLDYFNCAVVALTTHKCLDLVDYESPQTLRCNRHGLPCLRKVPQRPVRPRGSCLQKWDSLAPSAASFLETLRQV